MPSQLVLIADDVKDLLEAAVLAEGGTIERAWRPLKDLADLAGLTVFVVPRVEDSKPASRAGWLHEYTIHVGVQKRVDDESEVDGLVALVEELADLLRSEGDELPNVTAAQVATVQVTPSADPDHLWQKNVFTSVIVATWKMGRVP